MKTKKIGKVLFTDRGYDIRQTVDSTTGKQTGIAVFKGKIKVSEDFVHNSQSYDRCKNIIIGCIEKKHHYRQYWNKKK